MFLLKTRPPHLGGADITLEQVVSLPERRMASPWLRKNSPSIPGLHRAPCGVNWSVG